MTAFGTQESAKGVDIDHIVKPLGPVLRQRWVKHEDCEVRTLVQETNIPGQLPDYGANPSKKMASHKTQYFVSFSGSR